MLYARMLAWVGLIWLGTSAVGCSDANGFDVKELDLRDFQRFRIDQTAARRRGCPVPYLVDPAEIERVGEGEYVLTFATAFASEEAYDACLNEAVDLDACDYAEPALGVPRPLQEADLAQLMSLFSSVSVNFAPNACEGIGDDPCEFIQIDWDDLTTSDQYCKQRQPWIDTAFARNVLQAVTELTWLPPPE